MTPIDAAVEELIDRLAVQDVISRMCVGADRRDWDAVARLFDDPVRLDYTSLQGGEPLTTDPRSVVEGWASALDGLKATHHMITNQLIELEGDRARSSAYFQATHVLHAEHGDSRWVLGGRYDAELRRSGGDWRITALTMTAVWATGNQQIMVQARPPSA